MTRLTDEELKELGDIMCAFLPSRGLSLWAKLLMDRVEDNAELRERRAADLSAGDVEALRWTWTQFRALLSWKREDEVTPDWHNRGHAALSVLARLTKGEP